MDVRTVNNLPPAAAHNATVRCLLAIELSKKSWIVAVNTSLKGDRHACCPRFEPPGGDHLVLRSTPTLD